MNAGVFMFQSKIHFVIILTLATLLMYYAAMTLFNFLSVSGCISRLYNADAICIVPLFTQLGQRLLLSVPFLFLFYCIYLPILLWSLLLHSNELTSAFFFIIPLPIFFFRLLCSCSNILN